jgi:hypothetical protein
MDERTYERKRNKERTNGRTNKENLMGLLPTNFTTSSTYPHLGDYSNEDIFREYRYTKRGPVCYLYTSSA